MELHEMLTMLSSLSVSQADFLKGGKVKAKVEKREALIAQIDQMDRELGLGPYADNS